MVCKPGIWARLFLSPSESRELFYDSIMPYLCSQIVRSFVRGAAACEEIQFAVTAEWKKRIRKREGGHKLREITLFSIGNPWI